MLDLNHLMLDRERAVGSQNTRTPAQVMVPQYDPFHRMFDVAAISGYLALMANQLPLEPRGDSKLPVVKILWGGARLAAEVRECGLVCAVVTTQRLSHTLCAGRARVSRGSRQHGRLAPAVGVS